MARQFIIATLLPCLLSPMLVADNPKPAATELKGEFFLHEPVPLRGPFPTVLRTAKVGDRVLVQVSYEPEGAVVPNKVTAKPESPVLTVIDVIPTGRRLGPTKPGDVAPSRSDHCFAVLVRAAGTGDCNLILICEMSDGSEKKVPFQFKVSN